MAEVYKIFKIVVPEFETVCKGVEPTLYTPIIIGGTLDLRLISSPQSLSQILNADVVDSSPAVEITMVKMRTDVALESGEVSTQPGTASSDEGVMEGGIVEEIDTT